MRNVLDWVLILTGAGYGLSRVFSGPVDAALGVLRELCGAM